MTARSLAALWLAACGGGDTLPAPHPAPEWPMHNLVAPTVERKVRGAAATPIAAPAAADPAAAPNDPAAAAVEPAVPVEPVDPADPAAAPGAGGPTAAPGAPPLASTLPADLKPAAVTITVKSADPKVPLPVSLRASCGAFEGEDVDLVDGKATLPMLAAGCRITATSATDQASTWSLPGELAPALTCDPVKGACVK